MIVADTSVWIDHLRGQDNRLAVLLDANRILGHAFVRGELALGNFRAREEILALLQRLPQAIVASTDEVLLFIERQRLAGRGIGFVDASLLASVRLTPEARLWTVDRRLGDVARALDLHAHPLH